MATDFDFVQQMNDRTKSFALRVIKLYQSLPKTVEVQIIGKQMLRSATSVAANFRAACRSRSSKEFYSKISIVVEEADETIFWFELLVEGNIVSSDKMKSLQQTGTEILKIMATARKNTKTK